ncbi:MAG: pyrroline-5-carboxylate reductase, partial [Clostridia bacterium]|nr:pyrroline-5-carboxylate reductase [Clostridia bacterium]
KEAHILRIMPNTCASIGKSYTCLNKDNSLTDEEFKMFYNIFSSVGKVETVAEDYFNVCAAVCSCGVAFGHMLVESMADGGVLCGMSKEKSVEMAAYAVEGACSMIMETGDLPTALKDAICSPGGMTAKAMQELENGGFRASVINAIEAACEKGKSIK